MSNGSPMDSSSLMCSVATAQMTLDLVGPFIAVPPIRSSRWPTSACLQLVRTVRAVPAKPVSAPLPPTRNAVADNRVRGAICFREPIRGVTRATDRRRGALCSSLSAPPRYLGLVDHCFSGAHMPAVSGIQIASRFKVRGDQSRILVGGVGITLLDFGGQPAMQGRAVGFEL